MANLVDQVKLNGPVFHVFTFLVTTLGAGEGRGVQLVASATSTTR